MLCCKRDAVAAKFAPSGSSDKKKQADLAIRLFVIN
jgi:hypothetical protein